MWYRFTVRRNDLAAELYNRQTVADTRAFFEALVAYAATHRCTRILIQVAASRTIFRVAECGIVDCLERLSEKHACEVALCGDTAELCLSHEYIELLARQRGIDLRCFRDEFSALRWLANAPDTASAPAAARGSEGRPRVSPTPAGEPG